MLLSIFYQIPNMSFYLIIQCVSREVGKFMGFDIFIFYFLFFIFLVLGLMLMSSELE